MRRILLATTAILAVGYAGAAWAAESVDSVITLEATADNTCFIEADQPTASGLTGGVTFGITASPNGTINIPVDSDTAMVIAGEIILTYDAYCNYTHMFGLQSTNGAVTLGGVTSPSLGSGGGFDNRITYTAGAQWTGGTPAATAFIDANGTGSAIIGNSAATEDPTNGDFVVTINTAASGPLLAGGYSDTLTILLGAVFP